MKPSVVLIGRANVGKSTLFNRLTRSRAALVADEPGVTRDRKFGDGRIGDRPYFVVDTGGIEAIGRPAGDALLPGAAIQTERAVAEGDAIILLVDGRAGLSAADRQIAEDLRRTGRHVWVAVNKCEGRDPDIATAEANELGLGRPFAISGAHGEGVESLMEAVLATLPKVSEGPPAEQVPVIAVTGRPNVGKSTLANAILGEDRVVVSDEAGTTRDSIDVPFQRAEKDYVLIDTAGVRRRGRVARGIEQFSVLKTIDAIERANVVLLVIDGTEGVTAQDASLAGFIVEKGRALVLVVNKWDVLDREGRQRVQMECERKLGFLDFARMHPISALNGSGIDGLFASIDEAFSSACRDLPTPRLTRTLLDAVAATPPPLVQGQRPRPKYAHQGGKNPLRIVVHGNKVGRLPAAYRRYLANAFRRAMKLRGAPLRIEFREGRNPYSRRRKG